MDPKKYSASLDQTASVVPYFMIGIAVVVLAVGMFAVRKADSDKIFVYITIIPVFLLISGIVVAMYFMKPDQVILDDTGITIHRRWQPVRINFTDVKSVRPLQDTDMKRAVRTFGNGGVFGYTGQYYNKKMGSMTWYCTQRKNYILIEKTNGRKVVITPDNPNAFMLGLQIEKPELVNL